MSNPNRLTVGRIAKSWSKRKVRIVDFILNNFLPFLRIGRTNKLIDKIGHNKNVDFAVEACYLVGSHFFGLLFFVGTKVATHHDLFLKLGGSREMVRQAVLARCLVH